MRQDEYISTSYGTNYGGIRIRDSVHGDILIPQKFLPIIDAYAFQRLRRVRQLATAQYAFPGADHTRFAHSLGTFYVMQQIITHFENYFQELGLSECIDQNEKDLLLVAALLHDLGHTPFSHALEDVMRNAKKVPHEQWTIDIIKDKSEGGLFNVIEEQFGKESAEKVSTLILMHQENNLFFSSEEMNLSSIFHSLLSSQLDADRLDYLRRDSVSTGFSYGLIDIDRIISSFRIGILENGKAVVCVAEKNLPDVEGYLYARYQMYRNVYLKPFKMLTEELLKKIIYCVYELYDHDKLKISDLPAGFKAALQQPVMDVMDFLSLDDYVIMGAVKGWASLNDEHTRILQKLCQCLIYRRGYQQYEFVDVQPKTIHFFEKELISILKPYMTEAFIKNHLERRPSEWIKEFPFLTLRVEYPQLYKTNKDNIYILENSGRLVEISDCSNLIRAFPSSDSNGIGDPKSAVSAIYYNSEMLELYLHEDMVFLFPQEEKTNKIKEIKEKVQKLFEQHQARNCIEIEKKYYIPDNDNWEQIKKEFLGFFENEGYSFVDKYSLESQQPVTQADYYLDTSDDKLLKEHCSLRIRIRGAETEITCKRPVEGSCSSGSQGQVERYEYSALLKDLDLSKEEMIYCSAESKAFIERYLEGIAKFEELKETIIIRNERIKCLFQKQSANSASSQTLEEYELAFDSVNYYNCESQETHEEHQIEIELKSDPLTRLNMQMLTNRLEKELEKYELHVMTDSKYERAKRFTVNKDFRSEPNMEG